VPLRSRGEELITALLSRFSRRELLMAGVAGIGIIVLLLSILPGGGKRIQKARPERLGLEISVEKGKASKEIAPNAVYGKVMAAHVRESRGGTITVTSIHTGTVYTFSVGWHTSYHPRRYPAIGEMVKVYYRPDDDMLQATQVLINQ
jgi:hypothetical protein